MTGGAHRGSSDGTAGHARLILETANDAFVSIGVDGRIVDWNRAAERTFGWSAAEAVGRTLQDTIIPERYHGAHSAGLEHYLATGEGPVLFRTVELPARRRSGEEFPAEVTIWPSELAGEQRFNAFLRDVSERVRLQTHVALLQRVTAAANAASDVEAAVRTTLDEVAALTGWPVAQCYLVRHDDGRLEPTGWWTATSGSYARFVALTEETCFEVGEGLPGRVAAAADAAWITELGEDPDFPRLRAARADGLHAAAAFPVVSGEQVLAVLEFFATQPAAPDEELLGLMRNVGVQLGRVFERVGFRQELERSADLTRRMASMVSHDLRAPIAAINGFASLLREDWAVLSDDDKLDMIAAVQRQSWRVLQLAGDLLTVTRLQAGAVTAHASPVTLRDLVARTATDYGVEDVVLDVPADLAVLADPEHLVRILANLLLNAQKHGAPPIEVAASAADREIAVSVRDHGRGVPADFRQRLFQRFAQASPGTRGGSGLGLSIVAGLAEANGGRVEHHDADPGACFVVLLPAAG